MRQDIRGGPQVREIRAIRGGTGVESEQSGEQQENMTKKVRETENPTPAR